MSTRKEGSEAGVVRRVFRLCAEGWSLNQIAEILNAEEAGSNKGPVSSTAALHSIFGYKKEDWHVEEPE